MNVIALATKRKNSSPVSLAINNACASIAPNWPLDQMIAVNPYWQYKHKRFTEVSAKLSALAGIQSVMPHQHWLDLYRKGELTDQALRWAIERNRTELTTDTCIQTLKHPPVRPPSWKTLSDLFDAHRDVTQMHWREEALYQTSQFCAAYFHTDSPVEHVADPSPANALYRSWRKAIMRDAGVRIAMGIGPLKPILHALPDAVDELIKAAVTALQVDEGVLEDYLHSLLLGINGWASYISYRTWHASSDEMQGLLAIALAWEWVIWQQAHQHQPEVAKQVRLRWQSEQRQLPQKVRQHAEYEHLLWLCFDAYEHQRQQRMQQLLLANDKPKALQEPEVQALFCIDVRSEVIRRALEEQSPRIQTAGFAGFFGMPIHYQPQHTEVSRPQLPGLITTRITASERQAPSARLAPSRIGAAWKNWSQSPIGAFSLVETAGWWYAFTLLKKTWLPSRSENPLNKLSHQQDWVLHECGDALDLDRCTELAAEALKAMGIRKFAPTVLLIGHVSETTNNLHGAGLDCGACGGQSGEVNVRVLAQLLNRQDIREKLNARGYTIEANTRFIAGIHNTTTDDLTCFDDNLSPTLLNWLSEASIKAQAERAQHFPDNLRLETKKRRHQLFRLRSRDWSQVQPEWGLAGNRAFIIAPRSWSRGVDLEGNCFLHDYMWQQDEDGTVLDTLMTAPMIVTNWINMQYNASVTDNEKFGSGNKILHNAVNDNIGVFEGNSGDLRIGLPKQSLHNGKHWMHTPERLSVYIAAPRSKIAGIVGKHRALKDLIDNDWLYLFSWNQHGKIDRYYQNTWHHTAGLSL